MFQPPCSLRRTTSTRCEESVVRPRHDQAHHSTTHTQPPSHPFALTSNSYPAPVLTPPPLLRRSSPLAPAPIPRPVKELGRAVPLPEDLPPRPLRAPRPRPRPPPPLPPAEAEPRWLRPGGMVQAVAGKTRGEARALSPFVSCLLAPRSPPAIFMRQSREVPRPTEQPPPRPTPAKKRPRFHTHGITSPTPPFPRLPAAQKHAELWVGCARSLGGLLQCRALCRVCRPYPRCLGVLETCDHPTAAALVARQRRRPR